MEETDDKERAAPQWQRLFPS